MKMPFQGLFDCVEWTNVSTVATKRLVFWLAVSRVAERCTSTSVLTYS